MKSDSIVIMNNKKCKQQHMEESFLRTIRIKTSYQKLYWGHNNWTESRSVTMGTRQRSTLKLLTTESG